MTGKDDSFEVLLDSVLQEHVEPRAGLEQHILARVRAERLPVRIPFWRYVLMALPLVALAAFLVLHQREISPSRKPAEVALEQTTPPTMEAQHITAPRAAMRHAAPHRVAEKELSKQIRFPSPVTATEEGRSLAEWAQQHPKEAEHLLKLQQADSASAELTIEPIHVAAIEVPPLRH